jgi:hypothetical protein
MRLEIAKILTRSPTMLATGTQIRQAPSNGFLCVLGVFAVNTGRIRVHPLLITILAISRSRSFMNSG